MIHYDGVVDDKPTRPHLTDQQLLTRYRRVATLAKWSAILSTGEVTSWLTAYREGRQWDCEAVNSYGGVQALVKRVAQLRTNYSVRHMLGLGQFTNCQSCVPHTDCECPCLTCSFVR